MKKISSSIAYLLTKYECVVIPGLGAFIVSGKDNVAYEKEYFSLSSSLISFNTNIIHNDGLLANFIANTENISYSEACVSINSYVNQIQRKIEEKERILIPWVGKLESSKEGKILFSPATQLSCNANNLGFNEFIISPLQELSDLYINNNINSFDKNQTIDNSFIKKLQKIASVAAFLALFAISAPLEESNSNYSQQAGLFSIHSKMISGNISLEKESEKTTIVISQEKGQIPGTHISSKKGDRLYYIVISSLPTLEIANQKAAEYKQTEFPEAGVISSGEKNRVYIKTFEDKKEAEIYLIQFRKDFPKYAKAWLLGQNNPR